MRWAHDGFVGVRFATALRPRELGAMLNLTFGTQADRERTLDKIMAIHRRVNGTLPSAAAKRMRW